MAFVWYQVLCTRSACASILCSSCDFAGGQCNNHIDLATSESPDTGLLDFEDVYLLTSVRNNRRQAMLGWESSGRAGAVILADISNRFL